ncbi:MAG: thiol oxidoreductase [Sphingobacteriales bacterium]|nr:MAG: thiol oxidoreductase [Sphingobacteriales bacterium]
MTKGALILGLFGISLLAMCRKAAPFPEADYDQRLTGGIATVFDESAKAFTHAVDGLNSRDARVHTLGDLAFEQTFVAAPASVNGGLGPVFNNVSCLSCHHNDGKGSPTLGQNNSSMLFRISVPGQNEYGGPVPVPGFGTQLQNRALLGSRAEATVSVSYMPFSVTYADGETLELRRPTYRITDPYTAYSGTAFSPRMAPPVFGVGLLETIPEATLRSFVDESDADGDGISGKANYVYNPVTGQRQIGRLGFKSNTADVLHQVASAYHQDMGVTNYLFPNESCAGQPQYVKLSDAPDLADSTVKAVAFYLRTLAVPARRQVADPTVLKGQDLFKQLNCSGCHKPVLRTGIDQTKPYLSNQRIQPYTDLLLHDMGPELADGFTDNYATGSEWRTMPLWGIGLFERTNGTAFYLHDGRARSLEEAILWHGGESEKAKEAFRKLGKAERQALLRFIKTL